MKISRTEQSQMAYRAEQLRLQYNRTNDLRVQMERKKFDKIVAERVSRNIRLGLDKGRNIDVEC
jgi:hypothetical protein